MRLPPELNKSASPRQIGITSRHPVKAMRFVMLKQATSSSWPSLAHHSTSLVSAWKGPWQTRLTVRGTSSTGQECCMPRKSATKFIRPAHNGYLSRCLLPWCSVLAVAAHFDWRPARPLAASDKSKRLADFHKLKMLDRHDVSAAGLLCE